MRLNDYMDKRRKLNDDEKHVPIKVYLKKKHLIKLDDIKNKEKITRSSLINRILENYFK